MLVAVLSATTNGNKPSDPDQRHHFYEVWIACPGIKNGRSSPCERKDGLCESTVEELIWPLEVIVGRFLRAKSIIFEVWNMGGRHIRLAIHFIIKLENYWDYTRHQYVNFR